MSSKPVTRRDSLDFRDHIYRPALLSLASEMHPVKSRIHIRDQGFEGACTGFGLAAVIDYLNGERGVRDQVSARMLYEMAKHHDQWPGEDYDGSTARGAMKGWHKNGVCGEREWPYDPEEPGELTKDRAQGALRFPLGAYYRVMPRRSDLHAALNETGAVFATAETHKGWDAERVEDGVIPFDPRWKPEGGHAFAIVGYDERGFVIQNSWGEEWGGLRLGRTRYAGLAIWTYEDFEKNLWDAWVARLALPVVTLRALQPGWIRDTDRGVELVQKAPPRHEIADHYVHVDDGAFDPFGDYPSREAEVERSIGRVLDPAGKLPKAVVIYAHGGLNDVKNSAARVAAWQPVLEANGIFGLHVIWETGLWAELRDVLLGKESFAKERAGGFGEWWDRLVERSTHALGHALWKEMLSDADLAFAEGKAGTRVVELLLAALARIPASKRPPVHLVGHSAGSVLFAHLLRRWRAAASKDLTLGSLVLFAPACTTALFDQAIAPALRDGWVEDLHHFLLDDVAEQSDNVGGIYRKSLLYLVSRSYQKRGEVVPIMGMARYLGKLDTAGIKSRVHHYDTREHPEMTGATSHGGFDNDLRTMNAMLAIVLGGAPKREFKAAELATY